MLDSKKIVVSFNNVKDGKFDLVSNLVHYLVWDSEKNRVKKGYDKMVAVILDAMPNATPLDITKEELAPIAGDIDVLSFLELRKEYKAILSKLADLDKLGVNHNTYSSLNSTDKIFLILSAHTAIGSINLTKSCLETGEIDDDGKPKYYDFGELVKKWYTTNAGFKTIRENLLGCFKRLTGSEGELFYPVKLKRSDISTLDVNNFAAIFGGKASRSKDKNGNYGKYTWNQTFDNKRVLPALTTIFAVILDRKEELEVIKPNKTENKEEKK